MRFAMGILVALLVLFPGTSYAQFSRWTPDESPFLVDVNFGMAASLAQDRQFQSRFITFGELGTSFADYPTPSNTATFVDIGGSYIFGRTYGVGVSFSRTSFEDAVGVSTTIPHPTFFAAPATSAGVSGELTRTETATHVFLIGIPVRTNTLQWRIFGGPTIFWLNADMVDEVLYQQTFDASSPQNSIAVSGVATSEASGTTVGLHIGSELAYFFTRRFGVAGGVRYSYGTVQVEREPLSALTQEIRVGSTQFFGGLRFRFGG